MTKPAALILASLSTLLISSYVLQATIPLPTEDTISLNGTWRFKLEQAPTPPANWRGASRPIPPDYPEKFEPFFTPVYHEDAAWKDISVPGNWEIPGFSPATYNQPDNASGFYRLTFNVPAKWKGKVVKINFDGVQNGCQIWCNGQEVSVDEPSWGRTNYHESGWTAWQADLTPVIKFGQKNLLALRVTKNTKSIDCDTGDYFMLGGVYRPVTLFCVPPTHVNDLFITTKLLPEDKAEVTIEAALTESAKGTKTVIALEGQPPLQAEADEHGKVKLTQIVEHPKLWSAEFPNLYACTLTLKDASGKTLEAINRRVGIREVSIQDGVFRVNGVPVKLVGICRHDVYPPLGSALNAEVWKKDLTLMKAANFNAVRTSHYPYGSGFYDLCDQMGFYVLDEEPFCWVNCDDPELTPAFAQRSREAVQRDKNHPCVVIWGIGNENHPGRDNTLAAQITRQLDPTRPRLISCQKAEEGGANVEFDDAHYVTPEQIHRADQSDRRAKIPMIYTENPNVWEVRNGPDYGSLELWDPVIERTWKEIWQDEHVTGSFLWEWQDRAVADKSPTKYYYFFPETGINLLKVKGVVDGFRNPRPEYYHIKIAQSPIVFGGKPEMSTDGVMLEATNYYSFTDLSLLKTTWSLLKDSEKLAHGQARLSLKPRSGEKLKLALPGDKLASADTLQLALEHPGGWNVATYCLTLKTQDHPAPAVQNVSGIKFPKFNLLTGKNVLDKKGWRMLARETGKLVNLKVHKKNSQDCDMDEAGLLATPLSEISGLEADVMLEPSSKTIAHLRAELRQGKLNYSVSWNGPKSDVFELGWIFEAPKGLDHFSWSRRASLSYYPPDHIGRPLGTATPKSARAQVTKVTQPNAFDFVSTKFNCDWASLTDTSSHGLCFVFSSQERQHVRAIDNADGTCGLVVNRCYSPPRDISSPIVEDLYTVLKANETVSASCEIHGVEGF